MSPGAEDAAGRVLRKRKRRVRFAAGPLRAVYHTRDGHPDHEGQVARQRRELGATWPVDLTPGGVRMLEVELGSGYTWSLDRLKRRVGLLPPVKRPRTYATASRKAARMAPARCRPPLLHEVPKD
ncbi:hypothetical protein WJX81_002391 [Elliptochloris bilobata]|uniref:Transposase n=1 Tax=Elliptochloris bilobata TaxID=381761 RepID=A0AAW1QY94_9CHLO